MMAVWEGGVYNFNKHSRANAKPLEALKHLRAKARVLP